MRFSRNVGYEPKALDLLGAHGQIDADQMFEQAVRQPMILDDPAPSYLPARQRENDGASVALSSQNSTARQEEEEWILCDFDDLGNLIEEC